MSIRLILATAFLVAATFLATFWLTSNNQQASNAPMREDILTLLEDNPEIMATAINTYMYTREKEMIKPVLSSFDMYLAGDTSSGFVGNPDGDITIVEFLDYRCSYCRRDHEMLNALLEKDGNIKIVVKQYPILDREGQEPLSLKASLAALYAMKNDKFAAFHEEMMRRESPETAEDIFAVIEAIGLEKEAAEKAVADYADVETIQINLALGQQLNIDGTPFYLIGEDFLRGSQGIERLEKLIKTTRDKS